MIGPIVMSSNEESGIKPAGPYTYIPHFWKVVKNKKRKIKIIFLFYFSELGSKKSEAVAADTWSPLVFLFLNQGKAVFNRWKVRDELICQYQDQSNFESKPTCDKRRSRAGARSVVIPKWTFPEGPYVYSSLS